MVLLLGGGGHTSVADASTGKTQKKYAVTLSNISVPESHIPEIPLKVFFKYLGPMYYVLNFQFYTGV